MSFLFLGKNKRQVLFWLFSYIIATVNSKFLFLQQWTFWLTFDCKVFLYLEWRNEYFHVFFQGHSLPFFPKRRLFHEDWRLSKVPIELSWLDLLLDLFFGHLNSYTIPPKKRYLLDLEALYWMNFCCHLHTEIFRFSQKVLQNLIVHQWTLLLALVHIDFASKAMKIMKLYAQTANTHDVVEQFSHKRCQKKLEIMN